MGHSTIKLVAAFTPRASMDRAAPADEALPAYTIIVPLYREAAVAAELVANLTRLDYPRDRLQVLIVLEARDHETQAAFGALDLPAGFQVLIAPPGSPQTKPRACNIALERAHGELVVIYDAEDAPHPGQLREAAARFAQGDATWPACRRRCGSSPIRASCPTSSPSNTPCCSRSSCRPWPAGACPSRWAAPATISGPAPCAPSAAGIPTMSPRTPTSAFAWPPRPSAGRPRPPDPRDRARHLGLEAAAGALDQGPSADPGRSCSRAGRPHAARGRRAGPDPGPAGDLVPSARPAVRLAAAAVDRLDARPVPAVPAMDWMLMFFGWTCIAIAGAQAQRRAGHRQTPLPLLGAIFYWPLQSLAAIEALRQFVVAPFHWDKTPHTPRAANPLLPRLLARTGRALP
jgi:hypothetical protein